MIFQVKLSWALLIFLDFQDYTLPISVIRSSMVLCALVAKIRPGKRRIVLSLSQNLTFFDSSHREVAPYIAGQDEEEVSMERFD